MATGISLKDSKYQITTYIEMPSNGRAWPAQVQVSHKHIANSATIMWMLLTMGNIPSVGSAGITPAAVRTSEVKSSGDGIHIDAVANSNCRK